MNSDLSQGAESKVKTKLARLYYLDWLRVIAIGVVFLFHNNMFFTSYDFHLKNAETSLSSTNFMLFLV